MIVQTKLQGYLLYTIRDEVKKGKLKIDMARELGVSYYMVKTHMKDIRTYIWISKELEQRIRDEVKNEKQSINFIIYFLHLFSLFFQLKMEKNPQI